MTAQLEPEAAPSGAATGPVPDPDPLHWPPTLEDLVRPIGTVPASGAGHTDEAPEVPSKNSARKPYGPRGKGTASEIVEVYKILTKASESLSVEQIADRMPKTGFLSAAMNAYREHWEQTDPTWLIGKEGDRWPKPLQVASMQWWIQQVVTEAIKRGNVVCTLKPVRNSREGLYKPGKPPMVRRRVWVEKSTLVEWSADEDEVTTRGAVTRMSFARRWEELRLKPRPTVAECKALLELADEAIRQQMPKGADK